MSNINDPLRIVSSTILSKNLEAFFANNSAEKEWQSLSQQFQETEEFRFCGPVQDGYIFAIANHPIEIDYNGNVTKLIRSRRYK